MLLLLGVALAAVPDAARKPAPASDGTAPTTLGAKKLATANQCTGAVAFSGAGLKGGAAPKDAPLALRTTLLDKGVGWKPADGEFVCYCPGTYQFAFAGDAAAKSVHTPFGVVFTFGVVCARLDVLDVLCAGWC